jgi:hypothetical protein
MAPAAVAHAAPLAPDQSHSETLIARMVGTDLIAAKAAVARAQEAIDWTVAEWRHLWPIAPDALLRSPGNGRDEDTERDLGGALIMRDRASLPLRYMRDKPGKTATVVHTVESIKDQIDRVNDRPIKARTAKSYAEKRAYRDKETARLNRLLPIARDYEANKRHVRQASGIGARLADLKAAQRAETAVIKAVLSESITCPGDLAAKARVFLDYSKCAPALRSLGEHDFNNELAWVIRLVDDASLVADPDERS